MAHTFPPARTAGSVRTWNIAKYLARSGWAVTVLTPDPSLWRYVEHPEAVEADLQREGIRRLSTGYRWRWLAGKNVKYSSERLAWLIGGVGRRILHMAALDGTVGWVSAAGRACARVPSDDVDIILASGPTFSSFPLAKRLAERFGCPYVLDYRDLWSQNLHGPAPAATRREASVLRGCAAVTTVSPSWGSLLDRRFGVGAKLHVVSNGYDPEQLSKIEPHKFAHFAIVYAGAVLPPKRVVAPVMAALKCLDQNVHKRRAGWMFHYYGRHGSDVSDDARRFGIAHRVVVHGEVPRAEALAAVKGAGAAVVITSVAEAATSADNGMVTGKIFEAIGLRTPVLLVAPPSSDANTVADTSGLARRYSAADVQGIAGFIGDLMDGKKTLEPKDPAAYSWERIVQGLDVVLRGVM